MRLAAPEPLLPHHRSADFDSGVPVLDDWLKRRAVENQTRHGSRTFVVCEGENIVAYYAIAAGSIEHAQATGHFRRNMPEPVPVVILGRLAVDLRYRHQGIGRGLFRDATMRVLHAADTIGIRGIVIHALSEPARAFYQTLGCSPSPLDPMTLMVTIEQAKAML